MREFKETDRPPQGLMEYSPDQNQKFQFSTAIVCRYMLSSFRIIDVPPWGLILPVIGALEDVIEYNFEAETIAMPAGTVLGVRWTPHSGNNIHVLTHTLPGDGQLGTIVPIPDAWVLECAGQGVLIEYEASYPDGSVKVGRSFDVQVSKHLEYGDVTISDLANNDFLAPDKYPDGLPVTIDPIVNVEEYNTIRFIWTVNGYTGVTEPITLMSWLHVIKCVPGQSYEFVVPPETYTDLDLSGFQQVAVIATSALIMLPEPQLQMRWGFGGHTFWLKA